MQIQIPEPCSENWQQMLPDGQGRHCARCSKTVVDFTAMNDAQVLDYFKSHSNICGRFHAYQLNRNLSYKHAEKRFSDFYKVAACALLLLPLNSEAAFQEQKTDTIRRAENLQLQFNAIQPRAFHFVFDAGDSLNIQTSSLRFRLNGFELDTVPDATGSVRFQVPDSIKWQVIEISLTHKNGDTSNVQIPASEFRNRVWGPAEIRVFSEHRILLYTISQMAWHINPPITMGIPPDIIRPRPFPDTLSTLRMGWTNEHLVLTGDTIVSTPGSDTSTGKTNSDPSITIKRKKKTDGYPWDQFAFVAGLLALLASVVIWVRKDRRKGKAPGQNPGT